MEDMSAVEYDDGEGSWLPTPHQIHCEPVKSMRAIIKYYRTQRSTDIWTKDSFKRLVKKAKKMDCKKQAHSWCHRRPPNIYGFQGPHGWNRGRARGQVVHQPPPQIRAHARRRPCDPALRPVHDTTSQEGLEDKTTRNHQRLLCKSIPHRPSSEGIPCHAGSNRRAASQSAHT